MLTQFLALTTLLCYPAQSKDGQVRFLLALILGVLTQCNSAWAGLNEGFSAFNRKDYATAFTELLPLAETGDPWAQVTVAQMYTLGQGRTKDTERAVYWYRQAADGGSAFAQFQIGLMYQAGNGLPQDESKAIDWWLKAAHQGDREAQYNLAVMFNAGRGVPKDAAQAAAWREKAAVAGLLPAQVEMARAYWEGDGVAQDLRKTVAWLERAAIQGDAWSQTKLGLFYASGQGVPKDAEQAIYWLEKAAEQGNIEAQQKVGLLYTIRGDDTGKMVAYYWWLLASAQGDQTSTRFRDASEPNLTYEQRTTVQRLARAWRTKEPGPVKPFEPPVPPETSNRNTPHPRTSMVTGSGFYVSESHIVTNHHVAGRCDVVRLSDGTAAKLVASDVKADLAVLVVTRKSSKTALVRLGRAALGEQVTAAGFPLPGILSGLNITTGNVSSLAGGEEGGTVLQMTTPVQSGNSGGPLLDGGGNIVGVVVSKLDAVRVAELAGDIPQNVNFAITANALVNFLEAHRVNYRPSPERRRLAPEEIARKAAEFTVQVECQRTK